MYVGICVCVGGGDGNDGGGRGGGNRGGGGISW